MSTFMVENYVVWPQKQGEFTALLKTFLKYKEGHPEVFKGLKSWKVFHREFGGISGSYVAMWEFDSMADLDGVMKRVQKDEQFSKIGHAFEPLYDPAAYSCEIWSTVV
ncbi:MAG TPA: hypothetical protein VEG31_04905 [Thermoproteota archaeon]|nr:hypothetical protein [Thermoproteota archaeon]